VFPPLVRSLTTTVRNDQRAGQRTPTAINVTLCPPVETSGRKNEAESLADAFAFSECVVRERLAGILQRSLEPNFPV